MSKGGDSEGERPYRLEVKLPRRLNEKLEKMKRDLWVEKGKKVSKSSLVVEILDVFFEGL